jgi:phage tail-like protein
MPQATPFNPLLIFKFLVYFPDEGDEPVLGINKMTAVKEKREAIAWRSAGHIKNSSSQIPGGTTIEPITFEQGLGLDDGRFEDWALAASNWRNGQAGHEADAFRKRVKVDVLDLAGTPKLTYFFEDCWVSECTMLPELDGNNMNTVGIRSFTCQMEGWYRQ